jgi:hypothetical protein
MPKSGKRSLENAFLASPTQNAQSFSELRAVLAMRIVEMPWMADHLKCWRLTR